MYDAALVFRLGEGSLDRFSDAGQPTGTDDQDILYAAVLEAVQYRQPVLGTFILADFYRQDFFLPFAADSKDHVCGELF